ncbi:hypothetical protein L479_00061 [Exiguobacterium sp. S17]|nr:hypothetical protein L479_00061 [Exiguobacterium sp. S17]
MATWNLSGTKHHVLICNGSSCNRSGAEELVQAIRQEISAQAADDLIHTSRTLCNGRCHDQCVVIDYPKGTWYRDLDTDDVPSFVASLLQGEDYAAKVAHTFTGAGFKRESGVVTGVKKHPDTVKAVSKIF